MTPTNMRGVVVDMMPLTWFSDIGTEEQMMMTDIHVREWQSLSAVGKVGVSAAMPEFDDESLIAQRSLLALLKNGAVANEPYGAVRALIFPQNTGGAKAEAVQGDITWVAKKKGTAGNKISVNVIEQNEAFTITTFFNAQRVHVQSISDISQLPVIMAENRMVDAIFDPDGDITLGEVNLQGGDNGTIPPYYSRLQAFLDQATKESEWDTIALSLAPDDPDYSVARSFFRSWLIQFNQDAQRFRQGIVSGDFTDPNAGMDSSFISVVHQDVQMDNDYWLGKANVVRLMAGRAAGAPSNHSQTADILTNVTAIRPMLTIREREDADSRGLMTLIRSWDGRFIIERENNSFVTWIPRKNMQWRDPMVIRILDDFAKRWHIIFDTQIKSRVPNTNAGIEIVLSYVDKLARVFVEEGKMANHDLSKLRGRAGWSIMQNQPSPTTASIEFRNVEIPGMIDSIDFDMSMIWVIGGAAV